MSDLARSCEYLTIDKLCSAVSESEKARANRQLRCQNEEKVTCCYLCLSRRQCVVSCKFLGNIDNQPVSVEAEKTKTETPPQDKTNVPQTEKSPVPCCSVCYSEMAQAKTKFKIEEREGPQPKEGTFGEELPVMVYLCPQCGRIEFKADRRASK